MTADEPALPIDGDLYPDVEDQGGLAETLRLAAVDQGVDLGEVAATGPYRNVSATVVSSRGRVAVTLIVGRRAFSIRVVVEGNDWATGGASTPAEVVGVIAAWQRGVTLRQLCGEFPFMETSVIALGRGSGDPLGASWDSHLTDPELIVVRPLLEAARRHPRLAKLFPGVTHGDLVWFRLHDTDAWHGGVSIQLTSDGRYQVRSSLADQGQTAQSIDEAIAGAATLIPESQS